MIFLLFQSGGINLILLLVSSIILYFVSTVNYLLFHSLVEGFAIIVATLIYVLGTRTYQYSQNGVFLFLGISYLYVGVLDFAHTLTYKGMGVFPGLGSDIPTQLWIAGRLMEALSLFIILFLDNKRVNYKLTNMIYGFITSALLLAIMVFKTFPVCFIEGEGLTTFKIMMEYAIITILLVGAYILYLREKSFGRSFFETVGVAMLITAISELSFTLYTDVYGIANMIGHVLKVVSYYFIYKGVVAQGIDEPYSIMSTRLKDGAIRDSLTSLHNRQGMMELIEKGLDHTEGGKGRLGLLLIDLDNFKLINDNYGHLYGDRILKEFAELLNNSIRDNDIACRFGGDEFVVLVKNIDADGLDYIKYRIYDSVRKWISHNEKLEGLGISIGTSLSQPDKSHSIKNLLNTADEDMYKVKHSKK